MGNDYRQRSSVAFNHMVDKIPKIDVSPNESSADNGAGKGEDFEVNNLLPKEALSENENISENKSQNVMEKVVDGESITKVAFIERVKTSFVNSKRRKKVFVTLVLVLLIATTFALFTSVGVVVNLKKVENRASQLTFALEERDFSKVVENIDKLEVDTKRLQRSYKWMSWLRFTPLLGGYVGDLGHAINASVYGTEVFGIIVEVIGPYTDLIGFNEARHENVQEVSTQDRVDFLVRSVPDILPRYEEILEKVILIENEISKIEPGRYPERIGDRQIRANMRRVIDELDIATGYLKNGKPLLEKAPYILGADSERTYLIIFQNDKELRPTGGFMTAYSIVKVKDGLLQPVLSEDIYDLDDRYIPNIQASEPLVKYIEQPYSTSPEYRLRDMNWEPDFAESMEMFLSEAESAGIENIDGVIAVDTQMLVNIVDVLGVIDVPGFGGYSTEIVEVCDCPQIVYELEQFADNEGPVVWSENEPGVIVFAPENYGERKKIIGPMMETILGGIFGLPNERMPHLFEAVLKSISEKHLLMYMADEDVQTAVAGFGLGGSMVDYDDDYLMIVDANLGGRKSNLYVTQSVNKVVERDESGLTITLLTITYRNPREHDGWLNSILPNWVRIYVPEGSELVEMRGFIETEKPYNQYGKTVYSGFLEVRPLGMTEVQVKYMPSIQNSDVYSLYIQKQPGKDNPFYSVDVNGVTDDFFLLRDKIVNIEL